MRTVVILNGASSSFPAQLAAARAFVAHRPETRPALTVAIHDGRRTFSEISTAVAPLGLTALIKVKAPETDLFLPTLAALMTGQGTRPADGSNPGEEAFFAKIAAAAGLGFEAAISPPGIFGAETAGRLAAKLGGAAVIGLEDLDLSAPGPKAFKRVYAQNLMAGFELLKTPYCLSLSKEWTSRARSAKETAAAGAAENFSAEAASKVVELDLSSRPLPPNLLERREEPLVAGAALAEASTLVVAGRGLGDAAGVELAARTARALGGDWGASRPAVMSGWAPLERLVGVSGTVAVPRLCLAVGVSGAAALFSGVRGAGFMAAVNSDPKAPIMSLSDLAVVGDAKEILTETLKIASAARLADAPESEEMSEP
jgi:electron transfer flavoprotein alpha subunit